MGSGGGGGGVVGKPDSLIYNGILGEEKACFFLCVFNDFHLGGKASFHILNF